VEFEELKKICDEKIKEFPDFQKQYRKEIIGAKRYYNNGTNLYEEFVNKKEKIDNRYVLPFLLGFTNKIDTSKEMELVQIKQGDTGAIDIDTDSPSYLKESIFNYLSEKYGKENVLKVGTQSRLGFKSATKDILRVFGIPFKESIEFTSVIDNELSWEDNIKNIAENYPDKYEFYLKHKKKIDLAQDFNGKVRQNGVHAGGVIVTDKPVYEYIPVERISGVPVTAYPESGSEAVLDKNHIVKFDFLSITILDVMTYALEILQKKKTKLFLIEEDGIKKIVPEEYLQENA